jgi:hypothetical protein
MSDGRNCETEFSSTPAVFNQQSLTWLHRFGFFARACLFPNLLLGRENGRHELGGKEVVERVAQSTLAKNFPGKDAMDMVGYSHFSDTSLYDPQVTSIAAISLALGSRLKGRALQKSKGAGSV